MALIIKANPKDTSGAYDRLFGLPELGRLMSRVHSTVISSGTELERLILQRVNQIDDLEAFLEIEIMPEGVFVAPKRKIKKCKRFASITPEPDFLIFKRRQEKQHCHIVELKDGHLFDTKKSSAERQNIHAFAERNGRHIPYAFSTHFCCFNQDSPKAILAGFKNRIAPREAMTGKEFCDLLEIDYEEIVIFRKREQPENMQYFLSELVKIGPVRKDLIALLNQKIN